MSHEIDEKKQRNAYQLFYQSGKMLKSLAEQERMETVELAELSRHCMILSEHINNNQFVATDETIEHGEQMWHIAEHMVPHIKKLKKDVEELEQGEHKAEGH